MSNAFKVVDMITTEALRIAHEKTAFIGTVDRQYDDSFTYEPGKGKHGQTLRVREPNVYTRRQGSRVMDVQDQNETSQTITVATQDGIDMRFNSLELLQSVNSGAAFDDLSKNYIAPAMAGLMSAIEGDFLSYCTKLVYNVAGTAGTPPTDLAALGSARAKLNQGLAPKDGNRYVQMDSVTMGGMVNGLKGLFQDSTQIKEQYREGMLGRTAMADFYENERVYTHTLGSDVTINTDAAALVTDGGAIMDFHTTTASAATVGSVFTVAGVYAAHPETKQSYGSLQQFVIVTTGGTTTSSTVSPTIYLTGAKKNVVTATGGTLLTTDFNSKTLTFVGGASTSYVQNLMYHKEAFQFITADLPVYAKAEQCVRKTQDGISLRVWLDSDIRNDELLMRIDILYGFAALRPAWACRVTS